jgi:hypothetical protein
MNKILIIGSIFVMSACQSHIDQTDIMTINTICEKNNGLKFAWITNATYGNNTYYCNDGASFVRQTHHNIK